MIKPYYEKGKVKLFHGDCLDVLKQLLDNSVDSIITDPPYGLQFMNKKWDKLWRNKTKADKEYKDKNKGRLTSRQRNLPDYATDKVSQREMQEWHYVWAKECLRVAKPGCILMAMGGSRTSHRLACAIEDAGWEIRDEIKYFYDASQQFISFLNSLNDEQLSAYLELHYPSFELAWVYGQGIGLGHDVGKGIDKKKGKEREVIGIGESGENRKVLNAANYPDSFGGSYEITVPATELAKLFEGYNSRLKPAHENIIVAMKPIEGTYVNNAEKWGVAGFNIDGSRIRYAKGETPESVNKGSGISGGIFGSGKSSVVETKGRYPANILHDNSDEVNKEFDKAGNKPGPWGKGKSKSISVSSSSYVIGKEREIDNGLYHGESGSVSRYFKSCPSDVEPARFLYTPKAGGKERGKGNHPTVKPLALMRYLCKLTKTPTGGVVLDPFAGSGTTLLAAREEGREAIGIELEEEYCEITVKRLQGREDVSPSKDEEKEEETETNSFIDSVLYD